MSKRFGRKQKQALKQRIEGLEKENGALKRDLLIKEASRRIPTLNNSSMHLSLKPDFTVRERYSERTTNKVPVVAEAIVDPMPMMFKQYLTIGELKMHAQYPHNLIQGFLMDIETCFASVVPDMINNIVKAVER